MSPNQDANAQCFDKCTVRCQVSADSSLFHDNWYSLASSTTMYSMWAGYSTLFVVFGFGFWFSSHIQPIKSRSPYLVLISCIGGYLLVTNYAMAHYVTGVERWPCPFTNWALWLCLPLFLVPLPLRSLQLYFIFKSNLNKVQAHALQTEFVKERVTVVEKRRFTQMNPANPARDGESGGAGAAAPMSDIEVAKMRAKANKEKRKRERAAKKGVVIREGENGGGNNEGGDFSTNNPAVANARDGGTSGVRASGDGGASAGVENRNPLARIPSKLALAGDALDNVRNQLGLGSVRGGHQDNLRMRRFPVLVFSLVMLACFITGMTRQFIPSLQLGAQCVGCMVGESQAVIKTIVVSIVLAIQALAVAVVRANAVIDQYFIRLELQILLVVWAMFLIPVCGVSIWAAPCEELRLNSANCTSFPSFTQQCYLKVATANWLEVICIMLTFLATIFIPTLVTHYDGRSKLLTTTQPIRYPNFKVLTSLEECLKNADSTAVFQKFCISAFCVQNILFWRDVEDFKRIVDPTEMRVRSLAIYNQYMAASGNLFLELPADLQERMDNLLGSIAEAEANFEFGMFDYDHFEPDRSMFDECQAEVFRQMEADVFPRFQKSDEAKKLYAQFAATVAQDIRMAQANLIDLPPQSAAGPAGKNKPKAEV